LTTGENCAILEALWVAHPPSPHYPTKKEVMYAMNSDSSYQFSAAASLLVNLG
jgi:hypothetical protein